MELIGGGGGELRVGRSVGEGMEVRLERLAEWGMGNARGGSGGRRGVAGGRGVVTAHGVVGGVEGGEGRVGVDGRRGPVLEVSGRRKADDLRDLLDEEGRGGEVVGALREGS